MIRVQTFEQGIILTVFSRLVKGIACHEIAFLEKNKEIEFSDIAQLSISEQFLIM